MRSKVWPPTSREEPKMASRAPRAERTGCPFRSAMRRKRKNIQPTKMSFQPENRNEFSPCEQRNGARTKRREKMYYFSLSLFVCLARRKHALLSSLRDFLFVARRSLFRLQHLHRAAQWNRNQRSDHFNNNTSSRPSALGPCIMQ